MIWYDLMENNLAES